MNMTSTRHFLFVLLGILLPSTLLQAADAPTKRVRHDEFFTIIPGAVGVQDKAGQWQVPDPEKGNSIAESAGALLATYKQANPKRTKNGIFVYSQTHSMEWTAQDKVKYATSMTVKLLNDKDWRAAENKLVDELVTAANTEGVPVWILLRGSSSGTSGLYTYKPLTDPKLTLKK